ANANAVGSRPLPPLGPEDDQRAGDEGRGDGHRREQPRLDRAGEGESQKRCAARSRGSPRATAKSLARYSQQTATMAPAWMTISNSFARSPVKSSSDPATIRWPVEDTGRNSVRPSTRPRIAAT